MATSADPRRTGKNGRERFFAPPGFPSDAGGTKNSPLRGRVRLFRVLLPRRRHSENLACDAVCPMGLSRAIARRATLSKCGNSRGRYDRVPSALNFANARSTLRTTVRTPAFSGAACFKNTPRLTLGLQPHYAAGCLNGTSGNDGGVGGATRPRALARGRRDTGMCPVQSRRTSDGCCRSSRANCE